MGNTIYSAPGAVLYVVGRANIIYASGLSQVGIADTDGAFDTIYANGVTNGATVVGGGPSGIYLDPGSQADVYGSGNTVSLGAGNSLGVYGAANTINSGAGNLVVVGNTNGAFDTVNASGLATGGTTANGQQTGLFLNNDSQVNLNGSSNTVSLGTGNSLGAYGGNNTINSGAGNLVVVGNTNGAFDILNASGLAAGGLTANGQVTGIFLNDASQADLHGGGNTVSLGTGVSLGAYGGGNTINSGGGNLVVVGQTNTAFDTVNASGLLGGGTTANGQVTGLFLNNASQANLVGSSNTVSLGEGDSLGAYGGNNTINSGAGNIVVVGNTNGAFDTVNATGLSVGSATANGQQTGLLLNNDSQANVYGNSNTVSLGTDDTVGVYGGSNMVNTGAGNLVVLGNTNGKTDLVTGSGDVLGGTTDMGQMGTGILLAANTQANLSGSGNVVALGAGDTLGLLTGAGGGMSGLFGGTGNTIFGSNATINAQGNVAASISGTGNTINAGDPDAAFNLSGGNDDVHFGGADYLGLLGGTGYAVSGSGNLFATAPGTTFVLAGDNNAVALNSGDLLGLAGNGNLVIAQNDAHVAISGNGNTYSATSGGTAQFTGTGNTANVNGTAVTTTDGNPIAIGGTISNPGQLNSEYAHSPMMQDALDETYLEVLGRLATPDELAQREDDVGNGTSLAGVRASLAGSSELSGDMAGVYQSEGVSGPTPDELAAFQRLMAANYDAPLSVLGHDSVLAYSSAGNILDELGVLETLESGRTLAVGLPDGSILRFADTSRLADFLYAVAVQKLQADSFTRNLYDQDVSWLDQVGQPMLNVAQNLNDRSAAEIAAGLGAQAKLDQTAAQIALDIAAETPGTRQPMTLKVTSGNHETKVTVYPNTTDPFGNVTYHDIDPGVLGILEAVGVIILNVAAAAFPETGLPYAAAVVDAAEAGKDFANGQVLDGILSLAAAAGAVTGALDLADISTVINVAAEGVGGVYGLVQSAEHGDGLGIIARVLEAAAAAAAGYSAAQPDVLGPFDGPGIDGSMLGPNGELPPSPPELKDPFTGLPDPDLKSFTLSLAAGLGKASAAVTFADALAHGNVASGLVSSLGPLLSGIAESYQNAHDSVAINLETIFGGPGYSDPDTESASRYPFGIQPESTDDDEDPLEVASSDPSFVPTKSNSAIGRVIALIGTDAHNTLADYLRDTSPGLATYNSDPNNVFKGLRPDFILNGTRPVEAVELKKEGSEELGRTQLQTALNRANTGSTEPIAVAGDASKLLNGFQGMLVTSTSLLQGSVTYAYKASSIPGVATYSIVDQRSAMGAAFSYLGYVAKTTAPSIGGPMPIYPLPTIP